jgi:rhodanese-related sulfurtransferase
MQTHFDITSEELKKRIAANEMLTIIDVREEWEYEEVNLGFLNIPVNMLPEKLNELEHLKNTEIIIHCKSGNRGNTARAFLKSKGFQNVRNLIGGIASML